MTEVNSELILFRLNAQDAKLDAIQATISQVLINDATTGLRLNIVEEQAKRAGSRAGMVSGGAASAGIAGAVAGLSALVNWLRGS